MLVRVGGVRSYARVATLDFALESRVATYYNAKARVSPYHPAFLAIDPKGPMLDQQSVVCNAE